MDKVGLEDGCGCLAGRGTMGRARRRPSVSSGHAVGIPHLEVCLQLEDHGPGPRTPGATSTQLPS